MISTSDTWPHTSARDIRSFRGIHSGEHLLILGNGPSCRMYNLVQAIDAGCKIIGLNQAWRLCAMDYHVMGDPKQYEMFRRECSSAGGHLSTLFTTETGPDYAIRVRGLHNDPDHPKRFSFDLTEGVYLNNTIVSFGFQLAVWMLGERGTIYLLGIDSDGPQFDGSQMPPGTFENQRETLGYIAGVLQTVRKPLFVGATLYDGIAVYDLSPVSKQRVFERKKFDEVFG